jgi:hypothetical protein
VQLHLLSVPLEGVEYLREQATQATAAGSGGSSIDLIVPNSAPRVLFSDGPLPITADVVDANEQYAGELLLWLKDGRLKALEYAWVTDEPPTTLPPLASIRVARRH